LVACLQNNEIFKGGEMEWISVEKRLPEDASNVIIAIDKINDMDGLIYHFRVYLGWYGNDRKNWYIDSIPVKHPIKVTHWMPLPEPPVK
jgi:hypothetical protein